MAGAADTDLKYIRIGEHKDFTRIVFEFSGAVSFRQPELKGEGTAAILFEKTQTTLPQKIVSETAKWVDTISFSRNQSDLVATITFSFPYFEVNTFSLSDPERVVIDVKKTSTPPKGTILEEPLEKKGPALEEKVTEPPQGVEAETKETPSLEKKTIPVVTPVVPEAVPEEEKVSDLKTDGQADVQREEPAEDIVPPIPEPEPVVVPRETPVTEPPSPLPERSKTEPVSTLPSQEELSGPTADKSKLEIYLLVALVFLSAIIVALLLFTIFRKRRLRGVSKENDGSDTSAQTDGYDLSGDENGILGEENIDIDARIADVDAKIRDALKKIENP
jgi:hypothetical protein